jgi:hypothetical protein
MLRFYRYPSGGGSILFRWRKLEVFFMLPRTRIWKPCYHSYISGMGFWVRMWTVGPLRVSWLGNKAK